MKKTLATLALLGSLGLSGCWKVDSYNLNEKGIVSNKNYYPERKEVSSEPVIIPLGDSGLGMSLEGDIGIRGSLANHEETIPEKYEVIIKTDNHNFTVDGEAGKKLYSNLQEGDKVEVSYRENYHVKLRDIDGDGEKEVVKRIFANVEFLDANPINSIQSQEKK